MPTKYVYSDNNTPTVRSGMESCQSRLHSVSLTVASDTRGLLTPTDPYIELTKKRD
jgi:hypothetical protein